MLKHSKMKTYIQQVHKNEIPVFSLDSLEFLHLVQERI